MVRQAHHERLNLKLPREPVCYFLRVTLEVLLSNLDACKQHVEFISFMQRKGNYHAPQSC